MVAHWRVLPCLVFATASLLANNSDGAPVAGAGCWPVMIRCQILQLQIVKG
jgi:hypothetical protein